ncbi:hypothetical protein M409DRAFT_50881 [Zasmidium cellare ATCC 36951]|uniref:DUF7730 domain-containing protein n=1 Tax=Zasmidium cellare ATCC 36951 TaxID=1080233 RepID=A0A6A6CXK2_ZASCE|nr:uncharacterized protein M409DRAFT_50881 [Zasmidium cellare ATCC 36951]KAF2171443.1 hypothetical protein M409DRAFT_50881 [Zasmidium cellare ATCC 36951]
MSALRPSRRTTAESDIESTPERPRRGKVVNYAEDSDDEQQSPRPSRILPTNRLKKDLRRRYDANASRSGLLRLPPEIRDRIVKLVLGGRTIHIFSDKRKAQKSQALSYDDDSYEPELPREEHKTKSFHTPPQKKQAAREDLRVAPGEDSWASPYDLSSGPVFDAEHGRGQYITKSMTKRTKGEKSYELHLCRSACVADTTDEDYMQKIQAEGEELRRRDHTRWIERHHRCRHALHDGTHLHIRAYTRPLDLALLSVCRQLHAEAALLPYQENTFTSTRFSDLQRFITTLVPSQLHAIQHINICYAYHQSDNSQPSIENKLRTAFRSLKSLTILLHSSGDWAFEWERVQILADLMQFKKLNIEAVNVYPYMTDDNLLKFDFFTLTQFEGWAKEIEEELKKDWDTKDKKVLQEMRVVARKKFGFFDQWT